MPINITVVDKLNPEILAMVQSFYSRNHKPIKERLASLGTDEESIRQKLKEWYIGYGHRSIGQCGSTTFFIEGVSMLADKAVQDSRLYNGQETSTRFIDFENQPYINPLGSKVQEEWIEFYSTAKKPLASHLYSLHKEMLNSVSEDKAEKAVRARTFDILRAFLPAGMTTQLSWHTTLAHALDRLIEMYYHPLEEVQALAKGLLKVSKDQYPTAFCGADSDIERLKDYYTDCATELFYYDPVYQVRRTWPEFEQKNTFSKRHVLTSKGLNRQKYVAVPKYGSLFGQFEFRYTLDFGSFRDIQRHRDCIQPMPMLTAEMGFEQWYLDQLPDALRDSASKLIDKFEKQIQLLAQEIPRAVLQYYVPMGYKVPCILLCDYRELVYISELRTGKTVHPTLRRVVHKMADIAKGLYLCPIHADMDEDDFTIRRGQQDIVKQP